tara:strand:+ start:2783 stop:2992 length:210 start_codon:yes stop_codon:yes gene_type:complete
MEILTGFLIGLLIGLVVFLPHILAACRGMKNDVAICIMCWIAVFGFFVFSPLLICWPVALIWAVAGEKA